MEKVFKIIVALLVAAATPATIFTIPYFIDRLHVYSGDQMHYAYSSTMSAWYFSFVVAGAHAVILGLPLYFFVAHRDLAKWWMAIVGGFIIGLIPIAIFTFPHPSPGEGSISDGIAMVISGVTTHAGWINYIEGALGAGALGIAGGFSAWIVWRIMMPKPKNRANIDIAPTGQLPTSEKFG